jgi:hypothetical protein
MFVATSSDSEQPAPLENKAVADVAVFDLGSSPSAIDISRSTHPMVRRTAPDVSATSADLLLTIVRSHGASSSADGLSTSRDESSDDPCSAFDHFFASLEEGEPFAIAGLSSALS